MANNVASGTIDIGGRELIVSNLPGDALMAVVKKIMRQFPKPMDQLKEIMDHPAWSEFSEEERKEFRMQAARSQLAGDKGVDMAQAVDLMLEPDNCAFFLYMLVRKDHPDVTLEECKGWITDDNVVPTLVRLFEACGMEDFLEAQKKIQQSSQKKPA